MLGLNPMEQEIIDLTNKIARNGLIYFPEFCRIVHQRFRGQDEEVFRQNMFKVGVKNEENPILFITYSYSCCVELTLYQSYTEPRSIRYMNTFLLRRILNT